MRNLSSNWFPIVVSVAIGGLALAQTIDDSGRVFPYQGYLESNGAAANGNFDMEISLFTLQTGGTACDTIAFSDVAVNSGTFSVLLDGVDATCFIGTRLYLEMAVAEAGSAPVALASATGGRTVVGSVPSAAQASAFSEFFAEAIQTAQVVIQTGNTDNSSIAAGKSLVVTGGFGSGVSEDGGIEFRRNNLTQGIGFGYNTIYATGSSTNQQLLLQSRGTSALTLNRDNSGPINIGSDMNVTGRTFVTGQLETTGQLQADVNDDLIGEAAFRAGQFTVDSQDNNGLVSLVGGAESVGGGYEYLSTRGASKILLSDGAMSFSVAGVNGQTAGATATFANAMTIDSTADVEITNNLDVTGQLTIGDIDTDGDASDGCMRIGNIQTCWGQYDASTTGWRSVSFRRDFGDTDYAVNCTVNLGATTSLPRFCTARNTTNGGVEVRSYQQDGDGSAASGSFIAWGRAGSEW